MTYHQRLKHLLSGFFCGSTENDDDNLAIILCTYYSEHIDRPATDYLTEKDTDSGWGEWVEERYDEFIQELAFKIEFMKGPQE